MNKVIVKKGIECLGVEILSYQEDSGMISYKVTGTPVCQFDQHSRARVGIKFKDYKVSEEPNYVVYTQVWDTMEKDPEFKKEVMETLQELEELRDDNQDMDAQVEPSSLNLTVSYTHLTLPTNREV